MKLDFKLVTTIVVERAHEIERTVEVFGVLMPNPDNIPDFRTCTGIPDDAPLFDVSDPKIFVDGDSELLFALVPLDLHDLNL